MALYLSTMALHLAPGGRHPNPNPHPDPNPNPNPNQAGGIFSCIDKLFEWFPHAVRTYPAAILTMAILTMAVLTRCAPTRPPPLYTMHTPCIHHAYAMHAPCIRHAYTMHIPCICICIHQVRAYPGAAFYGKADDDSLVDVP
eukprot:scaffold100989_cov63-Phaeocystis_antarctica.AAC.1